MVDSSKDHGRTFPDGSGVEAPERISLGARARDAVRQRIVDGRYPQGARLVEREVAEELRMSRVPVREALRTLVKAAHGPRCLFSGRACPAPSSSLLRPQL